MTLCDWRDVKIQEKISYLMNLTIFLSRLNYVLRCRDWHLLRTNYNHLSTAGVSSYIHEQRGQSTAGPFNYHRTRSEKDIRTPKARAVCRENRMMQTPVSSVPRGDQRDAALCWLHVLVCPSTSRAEWCGLKSWAASLNGNTTFARCVFALRLWR